MEIEKTCRLAAVRRGKQRSEGGRRSERLTEYGVNDLGCARVGMRPVEKIVARRFQVFEQRADYRVRQLVDRNAGTQTMPVIQFRSVVQENKLSSRIANFELSFSTQ